MRRNIFICLLLAGVTLAIYWPVWNYGIVNFDDPLFVTENAEIQSGLNRHSLWWALSGVHLATCPDAHIRDGAQAVRFAERACKLTNYRQTLMVGTLAAAYAEAGRFEEAVATAQQACALASELGRPELLNKNRELLKLYRAHQPCR